jgi:thioredoxin-related protein|tara:strand:- start:3772 stop:4059 length:288 start_codon:yes stop_codon:yes gene_type:complete
MNFYFFTKSECGPCGLVKKYFDSMGDERVQKLEYVDLDEYGEVEITQHARDLAKYFSVHATPTLIVVDHEGDIMEEVVGGLNITQNIRRILDKYI